MTRDRVLRLLFFLLGLVGAIAVYLLWNKPFEGAYALAKCVGAIMVLVGFGPLIASFFDNKGNPEY